MRKWIPESSHNVGSIISFKEILLLKHHILIEYEPYLKLYCVFLSR